MEQACTRNLGGSCRSIWPWLISRTQTTTGNINSKLDRTDDAKHSEEQMSRQSHGWICAVTEVNPHKEKDSGGDRGAHWREGGREREREVQLRLWHLTNPRPVTGPRPLERSTDPCREKSQGRTSARAPQEIVSLWHSFLPTLFAAESLAPLCGSQLGGADGNPIHLPVLPGARGSCSVGGA